MKYYKDEGVNKNSYEMIQYNDITGDILRVEGFKSNEGNYYMISNDFVDRDLFKDNYYKPIQRKTFEKYYKFTYNKLKK